MSKFSIRRYAVVGRKRRTVIVQTTVDDDDQRGKTTSAFHMHVSDFPYLEMYPALGTVRQGLCSDLCPSKVVILGCECIQSTRVRAICICIRAAARSMSLSIHPLHMYSAAAAYSSLGIISSKSLPPSILQSLGMFYSSIIQP